MQVASDRMSHLPGSQQGGWASHLQLRGAAEPAQKQALPSSPQTAAWPGNTLTSAPCGPEQETPQSYAEPLQNRALLDGCCFKPIPEFTYGTTAET